MRRLGLCLLVLVLMAGACGGGDDEPDAAGGGADTTAKEAGGGSPSDAPDPCSLTTTAELNTTFGSAWAEGEKKDLGKPLGQVQCNWTNTDGPPVKTFGVTIMTTDGLDAQLRDNGMSAKKLFTDTKALTDGAEDLSGIGDDAFVGGSGMHILEGDVYVTVTTFLGTSAEAKAGLRELGTKIAGRL